LEARISYEFRAIQDCPIKKGGIPLHITAGSGFVSHRATVIAAGRRDIIKWTSFLLLTGYLVHCTSKITGFSVL
jgi:hypothetical protein